MKPINGFSKLSKQEKIDFITDLYLKKDDSKKSLIESFWHSDKKIQKLIDEFSENTITNFYAPFGVVPNVLINNKQYCVPMVIEESSVVAACARAAKFWMGRGGFKAEVLGTEKIGQVHFCWQGDGGFLKNYFESKKEKLLRSIADLTANMESRGGGVSSLELRDCSDLEENYFQIWCTFETCDAMGANFINSVLEKLASEFKKIVEQDRSLDDSQRSVQIIMAILSNYTPNCRVRASVSCSIDQLEDSSHGMSGDQFVQKFSRAVRIAKIDPHRATTHNKGIFNGIDAVVLATGNDFRAIEACGHAYAARSGQYRGLSDVEINGNHFTFSLEIPLALGTIGGLTSLHPLSKISLDLLGRPDARELMKIVAAIGLAQNFAAIRSLVTSGIQKGHMKMHLMNILNQFDASEHERALAREHFKSETVSFQGVRQFINDLRNVEGE